MPLEQFFAYNRGRATCRCSGSLAVDTPYVLRMYVVAALTAVFGR